MNKIVLISDLENLVRRINHIFACENYTVITEGGYSLGYKLNGITYEIFPMVKDSWVFSEFLKCFIKGIMEHKGHVFESKVNQIKHKLPGGVA